ncbi:hypothetical protein D9M68_515420 [compost metagenome]
MRNPFVDAHFQHLRVDQDQAGVGRVRLVQQRQDHGVDPDRLARAGRAGHQQVGHLGQVGHHRVAGDVLAQRHRHDGMAGVIGLRTQDLGQAHHLAARVRQFQAHQVLAGNGFHHTDADQAQRPRQILGQIDDLAALHAGGRLDFVAGDDRAGLRRHHRDGHAEVGQLLFDQARREFDGFGRHRFLVDLRRIQQTDGRQVALGAARRGKEQRLLLFLFDALGLGHHGDGGFDPHRLLMDQLFLLGHDLFGAHGLGHLADLAVFAGGVGIADAAHQALQPRPHALGDGQPREREEQAQANGQHDQERQRAAGEADAAADQVGQGLTDDAARAAGAFRRPRQVRAAAGQAQGFHAQRADQQQEKADALFPVDTGQHFRLLTIGNAQMAGQAAIPRAHPVQQQDDPPPGGKAEQIEENVRQIGAEGTATIVDGPGGDGVRPAWVGRAPGGEHQGEPRRQGGEEDPAGFAKQRGKARLQGRRPVSGIARGARRSSRDTRHAAHYNWALT